MGKTWNYLFNQFSNSTVNNYKKAVKLSNYHDADLNIKKAIQSILIPIYNRYHSVHLTLVSEYNQWKSAEGSQEGQTLNLRQLLSSTYNKMNAWDVAVQNHYLKGTPQYQSIFPNGKKPFTTGSIDERINAYDTLAKNMVPYSDLNAVMDEVSDAYKNLNGARNQQEGAKGSVKSGSGRVEAARIAAMNMQYRNLGFAMDNFSDDPNYIASMFDLQTLRDNRQTEFTGSLSPSETKSVLTHTFLADDILKLRNTGNTAIKFYLATTVTGVNSEAIEVEPKSEKTIKVTEFNVSDFGKHRYLTAVNQSVSQNGGYIVEIE